jgi:hypothetical protein
MPKLTKVKDLNPALKRVAEFSNSNLTKTLSQIETALENRGLAYANSLSSKEGWDKALLTAALDVKFAAARINDIVHAVGILVSLPKILERGEKILSMSLGAGNTNRSWDLETDQRIAEFKFIRWQGGAETIRQNALFKDFFFLAEDSGEKKRYLYVLGEGYPTKFLNSKRKLGPILKGSAKLAAAFEKANIQGCETVADYFNLRKHKVKVVDLLPLVPEFRGMPVDPVE